MKCVQIRPGKRARTAIGVALLWPLVWVAFLAIVPTECARQKIAERLRQASGRKVSLGQVRIGPLGGVSLNDLEIGAPDSQDDPWLQVADASINVNLWQLLLGRVQPSAIDVRGFRLRVLRRRDGSLELADLLGPEQAPAPGPGGAADTGESAGLTIRVREGSVRVVDEPTGTRLELTRVEGRGTCQGRLASLTELSGTLNRGTFQLAAQVDRSDTTPRFEGQIRLRDVAMGQGMAALAYLVPVLSGTHNDLDGKLELDLYLRGQGDSRAAIRQTLVGQGRLVLDPVALDGSQLLASLGELFDLPPQCRIGDVRADLRIKDAHVASENLTVSVHKVPFVLAGWTDFDGRINYCLRAEGIAGKLSSRAREVVNQLRPDWKLNELADLRIEGTVDALRVTSRGAPIGRSEGRRRLNEISRQARDQLRR